MACRQYSWFEDQYASRNEFSWCLKMTQPIRNVKAAISDAWMFQAESGRTMNDRGERVDWLVTR